MHQGTRGWTTADASLVLQVVSLCVTVYAIRKFQKATRIQTNKPSKPWRPCHGFEHMRAEDLDYDRTVVVASDDSTPEEVLKDMTHSCVSCAIVHSHATAVAIVDVTNVTLFMLRPDVNGLVDEYPSIRHNTFVSGKEHMPELIRALCSTRYVAIRNSNGSVGILSQGAIVRQMMRNQKEYAKFADTMHANKLGLCEDVITYLADSNARDAFRLMLQNDITSIPLTDRAGVVLAVMSMSDIKLFAHIPAASRTETLTLSAIEFLRRSRRLVANMSQRKHREVGDIVTFEYDEPLGIVLQRMIDCNVHHIYSILDGRAVGVLSFVDVLRHFFYC